MRLGASPRGVDVRRARPRRACCAGRRPRRARGRRARSRAATSPPAPRPTSPAPAAPAPRPRPRARGTAACAARCWPYRTLRAPQRLALAHAHRVQLLQHRRRAHRYAVSARRLERLRARDRDRVEPVQAPRRAPPRRRCGPSRRASARRAWSGSRRRRAPTRRCARRGTRAPRARRPARCSGAAAPPSAPRRARSGRAPRLGAARSATDTVVASPEYGVQAGAPASPGSDRRAAHLGPVGRDLQPRRARPAAPSRPTGPLARVGGDPVGDQPAAERGDERDDEPGGDPAKAWPLVAVRVGGGSSLGVERLADVRLLPAAARARRGRLTGGAAVAAGGGRASRRGRRRSARRRAWTSSRGLARLRQVQRRQRRDARRATARRAWPGSRSPAPWPAPCERRGGARRRCRGASRRPPRTRRRTSWRRARRGCRRSGGRSPQTPAGHRVTRPRRVEAVVAARGRATAPDHEDGPLADVAAAASRSP